MIKSKKGLVVSDKMNLTAVVEINRMVKHPIYQKKYRVSKRLKVHNPDNKYKEGDQVLITETKPMSAQKSWTISHKLTAKEESKS